MSSPSERGGPVLRGIGIAVVVIVIVAVVVFIVGLHTERGRPSSAAISTPSATQSVPTSTAARGSEAQVTAARALSQQQPENAGAWETLAKDLVHEAGGEAYVTSTGTVTSKGRALFLEASTAWEHYLALNPPKPNTELAQLMEPVYSEAGLDEPAKEVEVLQLVATEKQNDAAVFAELAEYAYKAHNTPIGDQAAEKAAALSPAADRKRVEEDLAEAKANPAGEKTYTTTRNGKTYTGKLNSKGELVAHEVQAPATPSANKTE